MLVLLIDLSCLRNIVTATLSKNFNNRKICLGNEITGMVWAMAWRHLWNAAACVHSAKGEHRVTEQESRERKTMRPSVQSPITIRKNA